MRHLIPSLAILYGCHTDDQGFARLQPELELTPTVADLGTVALGAEGHASIGVAHVGGARASIASVTLEGQDGVFEVTDFPATLEPGEDGTILVTYAPVAEGWHEADLVVTYDNELEPTLTARVRGRCTVGEAVTWPGLLDFGNVDAAAATRSFFLENQGEGPLTIEQLAFSASGLASTLVLPATVEGGGRLEVPVTLSTTGPGVIDETVRAVVDATIDVPPVRLRANDCEGGDPSAYDADLDGVSTCAGDCDDANASVRPGVAETADGVDQDCDGLTDEGTAAYDDDADGFSEDAGDCDDSWPGTSPDAEEDLTNGVDDDCDGVIDAGTFDGDGDGFGPAGGDCDDADPAVHPGVVEIADGVDQDCDGLTDDGTAAYDDDADGFSEDAGDCDDTAASVSPAATESGNWRDDDCDGAVDEGTTYADDDGDGYSELGGDCDDALGDVRPGAIEIPGNAVDEDCDGVTP